MVMSYLVNSNAENNLRADKLEEKLSQMVDKIEVLEYNVSMLSDEIKRLSDIISDSLRVKEGSR